MFFPGTLLMGTEKVENPQHADFTSVSATPVLKGTPEINRERIRILY